MADFISIKSSGFQELADLLGDSSSQFRGTVADAMNKSTKEHEDVLIVSISQELNIPEREVAESMEVIRAEPEVLESRLRIIKKNRLSLKRFSAQQVDAGVTYQVSKTEGRKLVPSAFGPRINRLGRHVFRRVGKDRRPIFKLKGLSIWGYYKQNALKTKLSIPQMRERAIELINESVKRILRTRRQRAA